MAIDFQIKDFAYPLSLLKLKRLFDKNQWLSEESLHDYQSSRLRQIISQAYNNVPYYKSLFKEKGILPHDIKMVQDLKNVPFLNRDLLRGHFDSFAARNAQKYRPVLLSTSGTTGGKIRFYADKPSNVLEFVYYWRFWGWAGYKLGDTFAKLSSEDFVYLKKNRDARYFFHPVTRQLTVNSMLFSEKYADEFIRIFRKFNPHYVKGSPLNLYTLALIFEGKKNHGISFNAVFSQGENLFPDKRKLIERVFACKVLDSYGHMERTAAISQCPFGNYHLHMDYGIVEFEEPRIPLADADDGETLIREIVGTSLHNFSMPLIRYRTGDFVRLRRSPEKCPCNRGFPTIVSVIGRELDTIVTPDGRRIAGLGSALSRAPGILMGQIVQENINHLKVKIVCPYPYAGLTHKILIGHMRNFVGDDMEIQIEHVTIDDIKKDGFGKFKPVISNIHEANTQCQY